MTKTPLPSPRSPAELDEEILAYAKRQLPDKKPYQVPLWFSGLATASIVAVAVLIVTPWQPDTSAPALESAAVPLAAAKAKISIGHQISRDKADSASAEMPLVAPQSARKRESVQATMGASALFAEKEMFDIEVAQKFDRATLVDHLQELSTLRDRGAVTQANTAYNALKDSCKGCELPPTLAQAIAKYLEAR